MTVSSVRAFSRFYTQRFGLLGRTLPASKLTLAEARVLYEVAQQNEGTAARLAEQLGMDKGQLSRIIARLRAEDLLDVEPVKGRGGPQLLRLSSKGRAEFEALDEATALDVRRRIGDRSSVEGQDLAQLLATLRCHLGDSPGPARLAAPRPGDIGWVIHRQSRLYWGEYGWGGGYEALITRIFGDYQRDFDPALDDGWIGWCGEAIAGSIFLMRGDEAGVAKLRLLYVEPWARGQGLGGLLVRRCIERASELGYRRMTLWTNDILTAARRLYEREGFRLVAEEKHHSFGQDLVGQTWQLEL